MVKTGERQRKWFSSEWLTLWVLTATGGTGSCKLAVIEPLQCGVGVGVLSINHVPASSVSGDDRLNELV